MGCFCNHCRCCFDRLLSLSVCPFFLCLPVSLSLDFLNSLNRMNTDGKSIDASTLVAVDDVVSLLILAPTGWLLLRGLLLRISRFTGTLTIHLNRRRNIRLPMRRIMDRTMATLAGCNPGLSCSNLRMRIIHSLENRCILRQLVLRQVQRSSMYKVYKISGLREGCGP